MLSPASVTDSNLSESPIDQQISYTSSPLQPSQHGSDTTESVDLTVFQKPRISAGSFPHEILVQIFQWLDIRSLDAVGLVSTSWHRCISSDSVWRAVFVRTYGTASFGRVTSSLSWKSEVIDRHDYLRNWKKSAGAAHVTFKTPVASITTLCMDFPAMRMVAFSSNSDMGVIADPSKGKVASPLLKTNGLTHHIELRTSVAVSRFGLIYGFGSGQVGGVFFSKGTTVRTFVAFDERHVGIVTCVWLAKDVSPRNTDIGVISGGEDGMVMVWNAAKGTKLFEFRVGSEERPETIVYIDSDAKDRIIVGTKEGLVYLWEKEQPEVIVIGRPLDSLDVITYFVFETDFPGGYVVVANDHMLVRHKITRDPFEMSTDLFEYFWEDQNEIRVLSMDKSPYINTNTNSVTKLVPGGNARYMIGTGMRQKAYVWDVRAALNSNGLVPLMHCVSAPKHLASATIAAVSINSLVFGISTNAGTAVGVVLLFNVLTGAKVQLATTRFPRRLVDYTEFDYREFSAENAQSFNPFHLELDSDTSNPHGIAVVNSAVQYFSYGVDASKSKIKSKGIKKKVPAKRSLHHSMPGVPRNEELLKEIDDDYLIMKENHRELASEERFRTPFIGEGLTEEDQLSYALMLSRDNPPPQDKDVEEAIKLSLEQSEAELSGPPGTSAQHANRPQLDDDDDDSPDRPEMTDEEKWQLEQAMNLSLRERLAPTPPDESILTEYNEDSEYDEDLELALKLSIMDTSR